MNLTAAKSLKINDRVSWARGRNDAVEGTVTGVLSNGIAICWDRCDRSNVVEFNDDPRWYYIEPEHAVYERIHDEAVRQAGFWRTVVAAAAGMSLEDAWEVIIEQRAKLFVETLFRRPQPQDYHLIKGAMLIGALIALERSGGK